MLLKWGMD